MKAPLVARRSVLRARDVAVRPSAQAVRPDADYAGLVAPLLRWVPLGAVLTGALFLRLYRLDGFITYYPDSYAQLRAVENLLSGSFPISYLYPPGVALVLAPAFAVLPDTILTMQAAILAAGMALVGLSYLATVATTGDRRAALFFAAAVALGATFVFYSRVVWFDVINTLLIATSFFLAPAVVRRGRLVLIPYGLLVFATITVRFTNLALLPALFLYSMDLSARPLSRRLVLAYLRSKAVITAGLVVLALYVAYLATAFGTLTRFADPAAGSIIDFSHYLPRLGQYLEASLIGYGDEFVWQDGVVAGAVLGLAVVGARCLWQVNRGLLVPIAYLLVVWSPVHAVYAIFAGRYAMPAFYFVLLLAALGLSTSLRRLPTLPRPWQRVGLAGLLALGVALFVGRQLALDINFIQRWPEEVAHSREEAYDEIRAALGGLDGPNAVLVSSQVLAVDRANPKMAAYDLIRHSETYGINGDSVARLLDYVEEQQRAGKTVYYLYTEYEDVRSSFRKYEQSFDAYFTALQSKYALREIAHAAHRPQRLYELEP